MISIEPNKLAAMRRLGQSYSEVIRAERRTDRQRSPPINLPLGVTRAGWNPC